MSDTTVRVMLHDPHLLDECGWWKQRDEPNRRGVAVRHEIAPTIKATTCLGCQYHRRQYRAKRRKRPALPRPAPGVCVLCGTPLTGRQRAWCSKGCADVWMGASTPAIARTHLLALHGARCWTCGTTDGRLDVDHVRPLWSLTDTEAREPRWWLPGNLQLLCGPCHKTKTAEEAKQRAALRRAA